MLHRGATVWVFLLLLGLHWLLISRTERRVKVATSDLQTNLVRAESLKQSLHSLGVVMAGSSMTGRLDAATVARESGLSSVNLGLDGCSPLEALRLIEQTQATPKIILIEANTLGRKAAENFKTLEENLLSPGQTIREHIPILNHQQRPVDLIYSMLRTRKGGNSLGESLAYSLQTIPPGTPVPEAHAPYMAALAQKLQAFRQQGTKIAFYMLPDREPNREWEWQDLKSMEGAIFVDLKTAYSDTLGFTDTVHLDAPSALIVSRTLGRIAKELY